MSDVLERTRAGCRWLLYHFQHGCSALGWRLAPPTRERTRRGNEDDDIRGVTTRRAGTVRTRRGINTVEDTQAWLQGGRGSGIGIKARFLVTEPVAPRGTPPRPHLESHASSGRPAEARGGAGPRHGRDERGHRFQRKGTCPSFARRLEGDAGSRFEAAFTCASPG